MTGPEIFDQYRKTGTRTKPPGLCDFWSFLIDFVDATTPAEMEAIQPTAADIKARAGHPENADCLLAQAELHPTADHPVTCSRAGCAFSLGN